jgi:hypothetical protein
LLGALIARVLIAKAAVALIKMRKAIVERAILAVPIHRIFGQVEDRAPRRLFCLRGAVIECHHGDDNGYGA